MLEPVPTFISRNSLPRAARSTLPAKAPTMKPRTSTDIEAWCAQEELIEKNSRILPLIVKKEPKETEFVEKKTSVDGPSVESLSGLMIQHYAILREITEYTAEFKKAQSRFLSAEQLQPVLEGFISTLEKAGEFFSYPVRV